MSEDECIDCTVIAAYIIPNPIMYQSLQILKQESVKEWNSCSKYD